MIKASDDEIAFFREQMKGIKPLKKPSVKIKPEPPPLKRRRKNLFLSEESKEFPFSDQIQETLLAEDTLFFAQGGLQHKVVKALRMGEITPTASLDLHGATIEQARTRLSQFLEACIQGKQRCVRIIHGKGKPSGPAPVLKNHLNSWLRQYPGILAFCSAKPQDGGTGAVYVLLKKTQ